MGTGRVHGPIHCIAAAGAIAALALAVPAPAAAAADSLAAPAARERWSSFLPLKAELATERGIELPLPFGVGLVYYHLERDIGISDVRVGRNGAPPASVSDFAALSATSNVENLNLKVDAWILPFVNLYAVVGYVLNESDTRIDVTLDLVGRRAREPEPADRGRDRHRDGLPRRLDAGVDSGVSFLGRRRLGSRPCGRLAIVADPT